jgi:hypothetical protein
MQDVKDPKLTELWSHIKQHQRPCLLPTRLVTLDELPLSGENTVDRDALLREPDSEPTQAREPQGFMEQLLWAIWSELLPGRAVQRTDHFFSIGGQPEMASRLSARIRDVFRVDLDPGDLLEHQELQAQARLIEQRSFPDGGMS